jgi:hypothetical protein
MRRAKPSFGINQEDIMNFARTAAAAAALCFALGATGTLGADASTPANIKGCLDLSKKTKAALEANQQSQNLDAARAEMKLGRDYCSSNMYEKGVNSYAKALQPGAG